MFITYYFCNKQQNGSDIHIHNLLNELREESQGKSWAFQGLWMEKDLNVIEI